MHGVTEVGLRFPVLGFPTESGGVAAKKSEPDLDLPRGYFGNVSIESIKARVVAALQAHGLADCMPAALCHEDRTLRRAKTPHVTDCRVEPPPPQRVDPFVFRAEVGPMEEIV